MATEGEIKLNKDCKSVQQLRYLLSSSVIVMFAGSPKYTLSDGIDENSSNSYFSSVSKLVSSSVIAKDGSITGLCPTGNVTIVSTLVPEITTEEGWSSGPIYYIVYSSVTAMDKGTKVFISAIRSLPPTTFIVSF